MDFEHWFFYSIFGSHIATSQCMTKVLGICSLIVYSVL